MKGDIITEALCVGGFRIWDDFVEVFIGTCQMRKIWTSSNQEKGNLDSEVEKHEAYMGKDLWFCMKNGIQERSSRNKSWVIRFWDTGWHNKLKTIKVNLTWINLQFQDGSVKMLLPSFFLKTTPNNKAQRNRTQTPILMTKRHI